MTCAREGCKKDVPKIALLHGDEFCSTVCFRIANGTMTAKQGAEEQKQSAQAAEASAGHQYRRFNPTPFKERWSRGVGQDVG